MERLTLLTKAKKDALTLLEISNWVDELSPLQIEQLAHYFQAYTAEPGTIILREGEKANFYCVICEGSVDIVKESTSGKLKKLKSLGPGKAFGEMAFFDKSTSSANVIIKERASILIMQENDFDVLCKQSPHLALTLTIKLIRILAQRLREASGKLIDMM